MEEWFEKLPADERDRRHEFKKKFKPHYEGFRALPLSKARNIIEHRGVAPVKVTISGRFGVTYIGNATERIPLSETPQIDDPNLAFLAKAHPIQPNGKTSKLKGNRCFPYVGITSIMPEPSWMKRVASRSKFMALRASPSHRPTLIGRNLIDHDAWSEAIGHEELGRDQLRRIADGS